SGFVKKADLRGTKCPQPTLDAFETRGLVKIKGSPSGLRWGSLRSVFGGFGLSPWFEQPGLCLYRLGLFLCRSWQDQRPISPNRSRLETSSCGAPHPSRQRNIGGG